MQKQPRMCTACNKLSCGFFLSCTTDKNVDEQSVNTPEQKKSPSLYGVVCSEESTGRWLLYRRSTSDVTPAGRPAQASPGRTHSLQKKTLMEADVDRKVKSLSLSLRATAYGKARSFCEHAREHCVVTRTGADTGLCGSLVVRQGMGEEEEEDEGSVGRKSEWEV